MPAPATREQASPQIWTLSHAQVSDEAERSVLVKLKTECGYQFTSKLESMFTDIKTSRDTMQEYRARRPAPSTGEDDVELAVQVPAPALSSLRRVSIQNSQALAHQVQDADVLSCLSTGSNGVKLSRGWVLHPHAALS